MKELVLHKKYHIVLSLALFFFLNPSSAQDRTAEVSINGHQIKSEIQWNSNNSIPLDSAAFKLGLAPYLVFTSKTLQKVDFEILKQYGLHFKDYVAKQCYLFIFKQHYKPSNPRPAVNFVEGLAYFKPLYKINPSVINNFNKLEHKHFIISPLSGYNLKNSDLYKTNPSAFEVHEPTGELICNINTKEQLISYAASPFVAQISNRKRDPKPLNFNAGNLTKSFSVHSPLGPNLRGKDVTVGLGDGGRIGEHLDFQNRVLRITPTNALWGEHSTHVAGTIFGAGLVSQFAVGSAPDADLLSCTFNEPIVNTGDYFTKYGMVLSNNSYTITNTASCAYYGKYDSDCRFVDRISKQFPKALHIVAAGNNGNSGLNCSGTSGYGHIADGYQNAKNTLTVGGVHDNYLVTNSSSKGPTQDGRLKPELVGKGSYVYSTNSNNAYNYLGAEATSTSAPNVTGSLALLVEQYRKLNSNTNPDGALLKAIAMNTATDIEASGPDYKSGFGCMNTLKAVEVIQNNYFRSGSVGHGDTVDFLISVPSGRADLKFMLYWHDTTSSISGSQSLINNLDLQVIDPVNTKHLPLVLDPSSPTSAAVAGVDSINNVEQVLIPSPSVGTYKVRIIGTSIPVNSQDFYITYVYDTQGIELLGPADGTTLRAGDGVNIYYEAHGLSGGNIIVEYSTNNGSSWNTISSTQATTSKVYSSWTVPTSIGTNAQGLFRVRHSTSGNSDQNGSNIIFMSKPVLTSLKSCNNQVLLGWNTITGVDTYEILRLQNHQWFNMGFTSDTFFSIGGLATGLQEWITLRGIKDGKGGRRMDGIAFIVSDSTCSQTNDISISEIKTKSGRRHTQSSLGAAENIEIRLSNNGASAISNIPLRYQVNGATVILDTFTSTLAANSAADFTFDSAVDLSAPGKYTIKVWANLAADSIGSNDTLLAVICQLANDSITLPFSQDFESCSDTSALKSLTCLAGAEEVDFISNSGYGRIQTKHGYGLSNGSKALFLDKASDSSSSSNQCLTLTYNLSKYDTTDHIILNFAWKQNGVDLSGNDSMWIRGTDSSAWIPVMNFANGASNVFNPVNGIQLTRILDSNGQTTTPSTQIKFCYATKYNLNYLNEGGGFIIDDIELINAPNDLRLDSILSPLTKCGSNADSVRIRIFNNGSNPITKAYLRYSINGGLGILDSTASTINANSSMDYTFGTLPIVSQQELHNIRVWVELENDSNRTNDTLESSFRILNTTSAFPFIEDFDQSSQTFYAEGNNSSWELGSPTSYLNTGAVTGNNAWCTGLGDDYNSNELSFLNSGCFDFSGRTSDVRISYHSIFETEDKYDFFLWQYSEDLGATWKTLGDTGITYNGYTKNSPFHRFDGAQNKWKAHGFTLYMDSLTDKTQVRFRLVFASDALTSYDGISIDNFHVLEDTFGVFDSATRVGSITGTGAGWVHYQSNGRRIMSIYDVGNSIGASPVGIYQNTGALRNYYGQYTADRNWWIHPGGATTGNFKVRLYFTEAEADDLASADTAMDDFRDLGITRYHGGLEDSLFLNNDTNCVGCFEYYSKNQVQVIPYFNGMYIEASTLALSEFWLNAGTPTHLIPLPNDYFVRTSAIRTSDKTAEIHWTFAENCPSGHFEIYRCEAVGDSLECINKRSRVAASCHTNRYFGLDTDAPKTEAYYRIYWVLPNGLFFRSNGIKLSPSQNSLELSIVPNPNDGSFRVIHQAGIGPLKISIFNLQGQLVYSKDEVAKSGRSLSLNTDLPNGTYILRVVGKAFSENKLFNIGP